MISKLPLPFAEPLMAMDTVKRTVEYARSQEKEHNKVFRFTITTNGILLDDETIDYINREMSNVRIAKGSPAGPLHGSTETWRNPRSPI